MDLHSLHRPTAPPAAQQAAPVTTYNTKQEWAHHTTDAELARELDKARSHVAHWKAETVKMDRIAQEAMQKLHAKREAKRALKAELDAARKDADAWRARYKELAEAHTKHAAETSRRLHDQASEAKALHEQASQAKRDASQAKALHDQASEARREAKALHEQLAKAKLALQQLEAERPIVQERLQLGGDAFRKLQALEPRAKQLEERVQQLEADKRDKRAKAEQSHQLELDLVAAKEKVRAATQDASAKTVRVQACVDMLARAEQVLKTCSQLHASKDQTSPLALALHDTTANISQFLLRVDKQ
jgi:chromosome segregation ATPase